MINKCCVGKHDSVARNSPLANARFGAFALGQHGVCGSLSLTQIPPSAELHIHRKR